MKASFCVIEEKPGDVDFSSKCGGPHEGRPVSMERKALVRAQKLSAFESRSSRITTKAREIHEYPVRSVVQSNDAEVQFCALNDHSSQMVFFAVTRGRATR